MTVPAAQQVPLVLAPELHPLLHYSHYSSHFQFKNHLCSPNTILAMLLWPPQVVLSNIAMIAENGTVLFECKLPEEFLLAKTMRLSPVRTAEKCGISYDCLTACLHVAINSVL